MGCAIQGLKGQGNVHRQRRYMHQAASLLIPEIRQSGTNQTRCPEKVRLQLSPNEFKRSIFQRTGHGDTC